MPDKEELEERITEMLDEDRKITVDAEKTLCYNEIE